MDAKFVKKALEEKSMPHFAVVALPEKYPFEHIHKEEIK